MTWHQLDNLTNLATEDREELEALEAYDEPLWPCTLLKGLVQAFDFIGDDEIVRDINISLTSEGYPFYAVRVDKGNE